MTSSSPRSNRLRWKLVVSIATLTALFASATYSLHFLDKTVWQAAGPQEGYYWAVAQYQIAFHRMREELRAEAAGEPIDRDRLALRTDILESKGRILTAPSELTDFFKKVEGYSAAASDIAAFQDRVIPKLHDPAFARESAVQVLPEFERMEDMVVRLANAVRLEEIRGREATMGGLLQRRMLLWIVLSASWAMLIVWLVTLARSERKFRRAAEEEAEARRSEKAAVAAMQEAMRAKSNFLGMVSHELRSPLQSIVSALDVLERRMAGAENGEFVARVRRSANALNGQLRDLLTLAKGEAGKLEVRPETFEASDLLAGVLDAFHDIAAEKNLRLLGHVPDDPIFAVADPTRIVQVLTNLISNAVKYTESGQVDATLQPYDAARGELVFVVADTGKGIAKEYLPSLFTAYTRFGSLERGGREGAGIGLAIVATVLEHLGGTIAVESDLGRGTTFTVRIPATLTDVDRVPGATGGAKRILIVDDRQDLLDALSSVAAELGYECDTALSAAVAANYLAARPYDLVLIDLDMPVKGGVELASETRRGDGPNAKARLLAISAAEGREVGSTWPFDGFLQKPIDRWALLQAIELRTPGPAAP